MPSSRAEPGPVDPSEAAPGGVEDSRRWSLRRWLVVLVGAVALSGSLVSGLVTARAVSMDNRDRAEATLTQEADTLAALAQSGSPVRAAARLARLDARAGWAGRVVTAGQDSLPVPFTAADVAAAADSAPVVSRQVEGTDWLVTTRPAGRRTVLLARRVQAAAQLTPVQRRRVVVGGLLGLAGGALAGLALATSLTRPLERLAWAARRLSGGDRDLDLRPSGPREVAEVTEAFSALSAALAASEQRQRRFLLAVSHELRTPLTAVAGHAETLADGVLAPHEVAPAAQVIVSEAGRLQRRVEDLLALARLESDDFRLVLAPVDLGELLRAALAACAPRAAAAGVTCALHAPATGPVVISDGERLRQAIDALIDNALRVLPSGGHLVAEVRSGPGSAGTLGWAGTGSAGAVRLEIRDDGPGLGDADLAVAFDRGVLTERYRGSRPVGSGVGLALVGELTRRLGGRASAERAPEGGVCFALELPAAAGPR